MDMGAYGLSRFSNIKLLVENNFNITPPNLDIWRGEFPFKQGDVFPRDNDRLRANEYLTNTMLYKNKFKGIFDTVFSWADYMQNPITNMPNMAIVADLPDFNINTESWVELIAGKPPRISGSFGTDDDVNKAILGVSSIMTNSNLAEVHQDVIRKASIMFGNKVVRVNKLGDGRVNLIDMPVKCWIPFVNENDTSIIEVNIFFNIFTYEGKDLCEFMLYYENGDIEKYTFNYSDNRLGSQVGEVEKTKAFDGYGVSPIEVFYGDRVDNTPFGESQYKYWDASIANTIRTYEAIGVLVEQIKEIIRVLPDGSTNTDEDSGITYNANKGTIVYEENRDKAPEVLLAKANVQLDQSIKAYNESLKRVSRDTGLPLSYFDPGDLGTKISADALKTTMFRSEAKAKKIITPLVNVYKKLIVKMALADGLELNVKDFNIVFRTGFNIDDKTTRETIQARIGGAPTMSVAEAIVEYDDIDMSEALAKAANLVGEEIDVVTEDISETANGDESQTTDGLEFTPVSETEKVVEPIIEYPVGVMI